MFSPTPYNCKGLHLQTELNMTSLEDIGHTQDAVSDMTRKCGKTYSRWNTIRCCKG